MNENETAVKPEEQVWEPIQRQEGERVVINGGRDYRSPIARIVPNTFKDAQDHEKAIHISQGKDGVSLSLATLQAIINWAQGN